MLFIKSLSKSDLTVIKEKYDAQRAAGVNNKQQAIVLRKAWLQGLGFDFEGHPQGFEVPLDITFVGPGCSEPLTYSEAAIARHSKDWRIQGSIIQPDQYSRGRFDSLEAGDLLVIRLSKIDNHMSAGACFVSSRIAADKPIFEQLRHYAGKELSSEDVTGILVSCGTGPDYPLNELVVGSERGGTRQTFATDPGMGGKFSVSERAPISKDELSERLKTAAHIGEFGEKIFDQWLAGRPKINGGRVISHCWVAEVDATAPFDFEVQLEDGSTLHIELKSTSGDHDTALYVSRAELEYMSDPSKPDVVLARLSCVDAKAQSDAKLALCHETAPCAEKILAAVGGLPELVRFVAMEIVPGYFEFTEKNISLPPPDLQNSLF